MARPECRAERATVPNRALHGLRLRFAGTEATMGIHKDEIKGKLKEAEGRIQEGFGDMADSPRHETEGKAKQAEGKVRQGVGKVKDALHRAID
jgi:uncharacterized protein YjbJ (UPF0337 family)